MIRRSLPSIFIGCFFALGAFGLRAREPHLPPPPPPPKGHDDAINAKLELSRPDPAVEADATGHVHFKEHHDRSAIQVHVQHLDPGAAYTVEFAKGGTTETVGTITIPVHEPEPRPIHCLTADLSGDQEVPPVTTEAKGMARFNLEKPDRSVLHYEVKTEGLSGAPTAVEIHKGAMGATGDLLLTLDAAELHGHLPVSADQIAALESGDTYVNVVTAANPDGEIRGQIAACPEPPPPPPNGNGSLKIDTAHGDKLPLGAAALADLVGSTVSIVDASGKVVLQGTLESLEKPKPPPPPPPPPPACFSAALTGDQEVPPVTTTATGKASFHLEKPDRSVLHYEIEVQGLSGPATATHIHAGAKGVPGAVLIPLDATTLRGDVPITPEQVAALESGDTYVDVHTAANPDGEIRGQIGACPPRPPTHGGGGGQVPGDPENDGSGLASDFFFDEFYFTEPGAHDASFRRGDANDDGLLDIADAISVLSILFQGSAMPYCQDALDSNDDGVIDISDPIDTLHSLFGGGGPLPPPGPIGPAGFDSTPDDLLCNESL